MSLDPGRLANVRQRGGKTVARCPACAEHGLDEKGEHLVIMPDGRFGCVANPGAAGKSHRQRIFALAGEAPCRSRGACMVRVRRPARSNFQQVAGLLDGIGRFGRVALTYARTHEHDALQTGEENTGMFTHTREGGKNPSKSSSPSGGTATTGKPTQTDPAAQDIDLETGYPIIDGAICPF